MNTTKNSTKTNLYVIDYYLNGRVKETINLDKPCNIFITQSKIKELSNSTHKLGKLIKRKI